MLLTLYGPWSQMCDHLPLRGVGIHLRPKKIGVFLLTVQKKIGKVGRLFCLFIFRNMAQKCFIEEKLIIP